MSIIAQIVIGFCIGCVLASLSEKLFSRRNKSLHMQNS